MSYLSTLDGPIATIFLQGSLSFRSYPDFKAATQPHLESPAIQALHIDMAAVEYLDSSALGMILHLKQKTDAAGKALVLTRPSAPVATVLKVVNFDKFLRIEG